MIIQIEERKLSDKNMKRDDISEIAVDDICNKPTNHDNRTVNTIYNYICYNIKCICVYHSGIQRRSTRIEYNRVCEMNLLDLFIHSFIYLTYTIQIDIHDLSYYNEPFIEVDNNSNEEFCEIY